MELQIVNNKPEILITENETFIEKEDNNSVSFNLLSNKSFIDANTVQCSFQEICDDHIIPVFIKDNQTLISHSDFINVVMEVVEDRYQNEVVLKPNIRLSHPIKGRVPDAKNKPVNELLEHEKTLYYERMAFIIDIPSISDEIEGNNLCLSIGGVKSFNQDNLYSKKGPMNTSRFLLVLKIQFVPIFVFGPTDF